MAHKAITQSYEANTIIAYLTTIPVGSEVTVADIESQTSLKLKHGIRSSSIKTARDAMMNQNQILFKVISGKLRRLTDEEKIAEAVRQDSDAGRRQRRAAQTAFSIDDYNSLSPDAKASHTRVLVKSAAIAQVSQMSVTNKLIALAQSRGGMSGVSAKEILTLTASSI